MDRDVPSFIRTRHPSIWRSMTTGPYGQGVSPDSAEGDDAAVVPTFQMDRRLPFQYWPRLWRWGHAFPRWTDEGLWTAEPWKRGGRRMKTKMQGNSSPRAMRKVRALRFFRCIAPESTNFAYKGNHLKIKSDYHKRHPARHLSSRITKYR